MLNESIKKMVSYCHEIKGLLKLDGEHFSKNDLTSVLESNKKKSDLLDKLSALAKEIPNIPSTANEDTKKMLAELKAEITECYRYIMTNSNVVTSNLQQLRQLWDRLTANKKELNCVYDQAGKINS